MAWKWTAVALVLAAAAIAGPEHGAVPAAYAACEPGTKIDATTADQARKKLEAAGYRKVHDLKKGCDNVWHAAAEKDGAPVGVALTPQGEALPERD